MSIQLYAIHDKAGQRIANVQGSGDDAVLAYARQVWPQRLCPECRGTGTRYGGRQCNSCGGLCRVQIINPASLRVCPTCGE